MNESISHNISTGSGDGAPSRDVYLSVYRVFYINILPAIVFVGLVGNLVTIYLIAFDR